MRPSARSLTIVLALLALPACGGETTSPLTDGTPPEQTARETSAPSGSGTAGTVEGTER